MDWMNSGERSVYKAASAIVEVTRIHGIPSVDDIWQPSLRRYQSLLRDAFACKLGYGMSEWRGEVVMNVECYCAYPEGGLRQLEGGPNIVNPSVAEIANSITRALSGVAYHDDCQITSIRIQKKPRIRGRENCEFIKVNLEYIEGGVWNSNSRYTD